MITFGFASTGLALGGASDLSGLPAPRACLCPCSTTWMRSAPCAAILRTCGSSVAEYVPLDRSQPWCTGRVH